MWWINDPTHLDVSHGNTIFHTIPPVQVSNSKASSEIKLHWPELDLWHLFAVLTWESYKSPAVVHISRVRSKGVFLCLPMLRDSQAHNWVQGSTCNQTFNTDNFLLVTFWDSYMFICIPDVFHPFKMLAFIEKVSTFVNIVNVILYVLNQKNCKRHSFLPWKETTLCKRFQPFHIINVILYVHQIKKSQCCTTLHCRRQHFTPWKEPNLYKRFMLLILKKGCTTVMF